MAHHLMNDIHDYGIARHMHIGQAVVKRLSELDLDIHNARLSVQRMVELRDDLAAIIFKTQPDARECDTINELAENALIDALLKEKADYARTHPPSSSSSACAITSS